MSYINNIGIIKNREQQFTEQEQSKMFHKELLNEAEQILQKLEIKLDDLLVSEKLEQERISYSKTSHKGMGFIVLDYEKPRVKFEIYPNEIEEPHFKVTYQNTTCRFKIHDCQPMKAEATNGIPVPIKKIMKYIFKIWEENKADLCSAWIQSRPTDKILGHQKIIQNYKSR